MRSSPAPTEPGAAPAETAPAAEVPAEAETGEAPAGASETAPGKVFASPRARKCTEKDVDLRQVTPTGGGGQRVAERDVLALPVIRAEGHAGSASGSPQRPV